MVYLQEIDVILLSVTGQKHEMYGFLGCFIMILILYLISSKLSCDFIKLPIFYIYLYYSIIFMTNKTFLYVNKISVCMSVTTLSTGTHTATECSLLPLCTNSLNH